MPEPWTWQEDRYSDEQLTAALTSIRAYFPDAAEAVERIVGEAIKRGEHAASPVSSTSPDAPRPQLTRDEIVREIALVIGGISMTRTAKQAEAVVAWLLSIGLLASSSAEPTSDERLAELFRAVQPTYVVPPVEPNLQWHVYFSDAGHKNAPTLHAALAAAVAALNAERDEIRKGRA